MPAVPSDHTESIMKGVIRDLSKVQRAHNRTWSMLASLADRLESIDSTDAAFIDLRDKVRAVNTAFSDTDLAIRETRRG